MIFEILITLVAIPAIYTILEYLHHLYQIGKYPPGPFPLPIIGNLHLVSKDAHLDITKLGKTYGDVFSISLGMHRVVILNSVQAVREAMITKSEEFAGRPKNMYTMKLYTRNYQNLGFSDGLVWRMLRKFAHQSIKKYGGDNFENIDKLMVKESLSLSERLAKYDGEAVSLHHDIGLSVVNIISALMFGKQYAIDDPEFKRILDYNSLTFTGLKGSNAVAYLPWLRFLSLDGIKKLKEGIAIRDPLLKQKVEEHKGSFIEGVTRDITDALIKQANDQQTVNKLGFTFTDSQLEMILNDLYSGGSETSLITIEWAVTYLLHWPKYQTLLYDEIFNVLHDGKSQLDVQDREKLHLFHGFINETLRLSSIAPLGLPRKAMEESEVLGFRVPKDATVFFNLWNVHHDEKHWENPFEFQPERWLNKDGIFIPGMHLSFLPFSAGRRVCLGERIAKHELFYFLSRLILDFKFEKQPDVDLPSLEGELGITLTAKPFKCILRRR